VLGESGSAAELAQLQRKNLFLVPLDGECRWYRYHPLFRDLLRARLDSTGGDQTRELLRRAAVWCEDDGQRETALHYAQDAEDVDRVARLAIALTQRLYASGRTATLMGWFEWVDERGAVARHPAIAAQAALVCALRGRPAAADRWEDLAERLASQLAGSSSRLPTDEAARLFAMWLSSSRALLCRGGVERMRWDVEEGAQGVPGAGSAADTEYLMRLFLSGVANLLLGDADTAEARFTDAPPNSSTRRSGLPSSRRPWPTGPRSPWTGATGATGRRSSSVRWRRPAGVTPSPTSPAFSCSPWPRDWRCTGGT
jgi:LuxR family maltose regulon positive regulatory protein